MPVGQFVWKNDGQWFEEHLKRVEGLPDDDPFFKGGMMGGSKRVAAPTIQKSVSFVMRWATVIGDSLTLATRLEAG
jgi:hypothetical protein